MHQELLGYITWKLLHVLNEKIRPEGFLQKLNRSYLIYFLKMLILAQLINNLNLKIYIFFFIIL